MDETPSGLCFLWRSWLCLRPRAATPEPSPPPWQGGSACVGEGGDGGLSERTAALTVSRASRTPCAPPFGRAVGGASLEAAPCLARDGRGHCAQKTRHASVCVRGGNWAGSGPRPTRLGALPAARPGRAAGRLDALLRIEQRTGVPMAGHGPAGSRGAAHDQEAPPHHTACQSSCSRTFVRTSGSPSVFASLVSAARIAARSSRSLLAISMTSQSSASSC